MDLDFNIFFTVGVNSWSVQLECIHFFKSKIHPNTEIGNQNLSTSKVVTFLYAVGTCLRVKQIGMTHRFFITVQEYMVSNQIYFFSQISSPFFSRKYL